MNAQPLIISFLRNNLNLDIRVRLISVLIILINSYPNPSQEKNDTIRLISMHWFRKYRAKMYVIPKLIDFRNKGSVYHKSNSYRLMCNQLEEIQLKVKNGKIKLQIKVILKNFSSTILL
jgi:hypothetical protein